MTPKELANSVRNRMYGERETYTQAMEYAVSIARGTDNPQAVLTAVMVVVNTLANYIEQTEVEKV
jgi:hypothetical protein